MLFQALLMRSDAAPSSGRKTDPAAHPPHRSAAGNRASKNGPRPVIGRDVSPRGLRRPLIGIGAEFARLNQPATLAGTLFPAPAATGPGLSTPGPDGGTSGCRRPLCW